ncbi:MAG: DUF2490 domain-containing protein [Novosphingobium sp.]
MRPATAFALSFLLWSQAATASEDDAQFWAQLTIQKPLSRTVTASVEVSPRLRSSRAGGNQLQSRALIDLALNDRVSIGTGLVHVSSDGPNEVRPHQQVTLFLGNLSLRTRLEERFIEGSARMSLRVREKATFRIPLSAADRVNLGAEALVTLRAQSPTRPTGLDQVRLSALLDHRFSQELSLSGGYQLTITPRKGLPTRISHVPQVTLTWRP